MSNTTKSATAGTAAKLSVSGAVQAINESGVSNVKAFSSMDAMMSAIKHEYGEDIKTVTSFTEGSTVKLKFEAFADVNDAIDL